MALTVIDRPGERGSEFFDHHQAVSKLHLEYAQSNGHFLKGKYGCSQFQTEMRLTDSDLGQVIITQNRRLESVGATVKRSHYAEYSEISLIDIKSSFHTEIKRMTLMRYLLGFRPIFKSPFAIRSKQNITLNSNVTGWMRKNKFYSAELDEQGMNMLLSTTFKSREAIDELLAFLKEFTGRG